MITKRDFLKSMALLSATPWVVKAEKFCVSTVATDNNFWIDIRNDYDLKSDYINLENGYYSVMAKPVMDKYVKDIAHVNKEGSYYMRTLQFENKFKSRDRLASLLGCANDELIITRNTTESMNIVIQGLNWKAGDEAIMAYQDYGAMLDMFKQQAKRYGIVNKFISVPNNPKSDDELVALYENAITPRTKLIMVCHMINITGHILPIRKICDMAHKRGVEVMVDGAHAVAHINVNLNELGCDYYGSSLHKWLGAPLGAGILFVKRDKIKNLWPLTAESNYADDDIRKLNHTGTNPVAVDIAIQHAIDYHEKIGISRKENRLRYLQNYWIEQVKHLPHIVLNTPDDRNRSCAISNIGVKGMPPSALQKTLFDKYKIWTVAIDNAQAGVVGIRVTPHVYTTENELDALVKALKEIRA